MSTLPVETPNQEPVNEPTLRAVTYTERRRFPRIQLSTPLPAYIGPVKVAIVDLSVRGARVLHSRVFARSEELRLTFRCGAYECSATARVVSSRVVSLRSGPSSRPLYQSHLALVEVPHVTEYLLARLLRRLADVEPREQVTNVPA